MLDLFKRWYLWWFGPGPLKTEPMVTITVTKDQAVMLRAAAQTMWNRKLQQYQQVTDGMSRTNVEHDLAQLERCLDEIDQATKRFDETR